MARRKRSALGQPVTAPQDRRTLMSAWMRRRPVAHNAGYAGTITLRQCALGLLAYQSVLQLRQGGCPRVRS
jgi:hypothetical protein